MTLRTDLADGEDQSTLHPGQHNEVNARVLDIIAVLNGGTVGQVLAKTGSGDFAADWADPSGGGGLDTGPDPSAYTFLSGDATDPASWYGSAMVHFLTWTPDRSGTVLLLPPAVAADERDYVVWAGTVVNTDYPGRTAASGGFNPAGDLLLADAFSTNAPASFRDGFHAVAGITYTVAAVDWGAAPAAGHAITLLEFYQSVQHLGGVANLVTPPNGARILYEGGELNADVGLDSVTAPNGVGAHTEGGFNDASGKYSHAEGDGTTASGLNAHAEGFGTTASGPGSHAEGLVSQAVGDYAHAEGDSNANGNYSHSESSGTANGVLSHAEASGTAGGLASHAEGGGNASGAYSHAEGGTTQAAGAYSHAEGAWSRANHPAQHAHAINSRATPGDAQYVHQPLDHLTTTNNTTAYLTLNGADLVLVEGRAYALYGHVVARRRDTPGTVSSWTLKALLETGATLATNIRLISQSVSLDFQDAAASTWVVAFTVSTNQVRITVTGENSKTIDWVGHVEWVECG